MEPYFFQESLSGWSGVQILDEETSKHCIQVLRMQTGNKMRLTDGQGRLAVAEIVVPDKKRCSVSITKTVTTTRPETIGFSIGIAFTKNKSRNEWLLEKLTEISVENIYPIITEHSEREKFNQERYKKILIAALLQSQQTLLPVIHPAQKLSSFLRNTVQGFDGQLFIAHCQESEKRGLHSQLKKDKKCLTLIGPEGDFSLEEVEQCFQSGFIPVHLGENRLRTETAGMYACAVYNAFQDAPKEY